MKHEQKLQMDCFCCDGCYDGCHDYNMPRRDESQSHFNYRVHMRNFFICFALSLCCIAISAGFEIKYTIDHQHWQDHETELVNLTSHDVVTGKKDSCSCNLYINVTQLCVNDNYVMGTLSQCIEPSSDDCDFFSVCEVSHQEKCILFTEYITDDISHNKTDILDTLCESDDMYILLYTFDIVYMNDLTNAIEFDQPKKNDEASIACIFFGICAFIFGLCLVVRHIRWNKSGKT